MDVVDEEPDIFTKQSKQFLSEDKEFAGMACGILPTVEQWRDIYKIVKANSEEDFYTLLKSAKASNLEKQLAPIVESAFSNSTIVFVYKDLFCRYKYIAKIGGIISRLDIDTPFADGTGKYAAAVLINFENNSDKPISISQELFFNIVSNSDSAVSAEYDFIELKNVLNTPWHKKSLKKEI